MSGLRFPFDKEEGKEETAESQRSRSTHTSYDRDADLWTLLLDGINDRGSENSSDR